MAKPTLLIGIGTSGLRVLEETQKFYFEHTGKNKPGNVEYLYLETDESSFPSTTVLKNEIRRVYLDLSDKETKINNLKDQLPEEESQWIPDPSYIKDAGKGAGGMPAFGRVALWSYPNFNTVKEAINSAFNKINNHTQVDSDNTRPAVFITGSLTGGTGSGIFIDIAYMIKKHIQGLEDVYGLFLTPGRDYMGRDNILYCNTLSSLCSLEKYNQPEQEYCMKWPDSTSTQINDLPFEISHFISQDRNDGIAQVKSLSGLYKIAGLWMFLNIFGLREKRERRLTDSKGSRVIDKYGSFGIAAVQYPKRQLEELLGVDLSMNLLKRWINPTTFYNKNNKSEIKSVRQPISNSTKSHFEITLKNAFETLDATIVESGSNILSDLKEKAIQINKKEYTEPSENHFIKKMFSSYGDNNYYSAVKNNLQKAEDEIIQRIYELISTTIDDTENLQISKIQLTAISDAIKGNKDYWGSIGLHPKPEKWENLLEKQIQWILKSRYKIVGEQDSVVYDRLKTTYELMKIHLLADRVWKLKTNIEDDTDPLKTFDSNITLPKISTINKLIDNISNIIDFQDRSTSSNKNRKTLQSRHNDIKGELTDITIPILRVYKDGSSTEAFERTYHSAKTKYFTQTGKNITSKTTIIDRAPLWDYINTPVEKLYTTLFRDCITKFESEVIRLSCFEDIDIAEYINNNPRESGKMALIAKTPLIMVNNDNKTDFVEGKGIPRLVIGKDKIQVDKVFNALQNETEISYLNSYSHDEDGIWLNKEIDNIVIFYVEQGYMSTGDAFNPLKHLKNIEDIKSVYQSEKERYSKTESIGSETWNILRNPYLSEDEFLKIIDNN